MLKGKITKTWSEYCGKWMYERHCSFVDTEGTLQVPFFTGWSEDEVEQKTRKLSEALTEKEVE